MKKILMAVMICLLTTGFVYAAEKGTAKEAQDLVGKAITYYKDNGKDKAFAAINDPKGQFVKKDLYVFVFDFDVVCLAHPLNKGLIGKNLKDLKDSKGKRLMYDMVEEAKTKNKGWIDYHWTNPATKKIDAKSTYYAKEGGLIFCCGIYK
jgi:cytochrome c